MSREVNTEVENKRNSKGLAQKGRIKVSAKKTAQKKKAIPGKYKAAHKESLQERTAPDFIFSYQATDDKNMLAIIDLVRTGISPEDFNRIVNDTPFSLAEWAHYLQLSERTIQRNQKEKKSFQPIQSERIVELIMLYNYGVDVFGDKDNFNIWLDATSIALGGRAPKELLDTKFGISMVRDELGRIEHGILA